LGVECLAELHDVDAVLTERRTDRRRRVRLPAWDLQLDECQGVLGHELLAQSILLTWSNASSTGTWRSKMSTSTFSFCCSGLTSTISPSKLESGAEVTFTDSPSANSACERGRSAVATPVCRRRSTSDWESGTGFPA